MSVKCKAEVMSGYYLTNCSRNAKKDGFCHQHHPDRKVELEEKRQERFKKDMRAARHDRECKAERDELLAWVESLVELADNLPTSIEPYSRLAKSTFMIIREQKALLDKYGRGKS